ncbi:MAG: hypothetical protein KF780_09935 [Sphingomonas sp.]|nr:hypothetical protein [Sphingomonas sp.]
MVSIVAIAALGFAQTAVPDDGARMLQCALVTPSGDNISFTIPAWNEEDTEISLVPGQGSIWPNRTLPGARNVMRGTPRADRLFAFGSGNGVALEIGEPGGEASSARAATLFRRDRQRAGLPLAYGYCGEPAEHISLIHSPVDTSTDPREIGTDIPALTPANWSDNDCGLLISDGRRARLSFQIVGRDQVRLESPELWSGRPVTIPIQWRDASNMRVGTFGRRDGPQGIEVLFVEQSQATRLIRLRQFGDASYPNLTGYGICGFSQIVRRPSSR